MGAMHTPTRAPILKGAAHFGGRQRSDAGWLFILDEEVYLLQMLRLYG